MISFSAFWFCLLIFFSGNDLCFIEHEEISYRALGSRLHNMTICDNMQVSRAFGHTEVPKHLQKIVTEYKQKQKANDRKSGRNIENNK